MRVLRLKQSLLSKLNQSYYQKPAERLGVSYSTVGFQIRTATGPYGEDRLSVGYEVSDFLIGHAVPPNSSEALGTDYSLEDFTFQRHPFADSKETVSTDYDISDFEFKRHPYNSDKETLQTAFEMSDFEYTGMPSIEGLYHAGTVGPSYITDGIAISTPALPTGLGPGRAVFATLYTRGALTAPAGWAPVRTVQSTHPSSGITQTLHIYRKDSVTAEDSGTAPEWLQSTSGRMGLAYTVVSSSSGSIYVAESAVDTTVVDPAAAYPQSVDIPSLTSASARELFLMAGHAINGTTADGSWALTTGSVRSQTPMSENRLVVGSLAASVSAALNGSFTHTLTGGATTNYYGTIALRLSDLDEVSGADGEYLDQLGRAPLAVLGFEKFISTATVAIRVRRGSDNAELDIGFVDKRLDVAALLAFAGTGTVYVRRVYDQTGAGFDLDFSATNTRQPKIVDAGEYLDVMRMDGVGNSGQIAGLTLGTPYLDIYSELAQHVTTGMCTFELGPVMDSTPGTMNVYWASGHNGLNVAVQGSAAGTQRRTSFQTATYGTRRLYSFMTDRSISGSGEIAAWQDGMLLAPTVALNNEVGGNYVNGTMFVGSRNNTTNFCRFDIRSLVIYRNRTAGHRTAIERILKPTLLWSPKALDRAFHFDDQSIVDIQNTVLNNWFDSTEHHFKAAATGPLCPTVTYPTSLIGRRVVTFNGTSSQLELAGSSNDIYRNVSRVWVFTVYNNDLDSANAERPVLWHATPDGSARVGLFAGVSTAKNRMTSNARRTDGGSLAALTSAAERSAQWTMGLALIDYSARTISHYVNGELDGTVSAQFDAAGNTSDTAALTTYVGRNTAGSGFFKGSIASLIGGSSTLTTEEIARLFGSYAHRYNLTAALPSNHPYKYVPPTTYVDPDPDLSRGLWNFTKLQLHFQGDAVHDVSPTVAKSITAGGTGGLSNDTSKFFYKSYKFGGNAWVKISQSADVVIGTNDYTYQSWIYPTSTAMGYLFDYRLEQGKPGAGGGGGRLTFYQNKIVYNTIVGDYASADGIVPVNHWSFIEVSRTGGQFYVFLNGKLVITGPDTENWTSDTLVLGAAAYYPIGAEGFNGYFGDTRLIVGVGLHTTDYSVPEIPFLEYETDDGIVNQMEYMTYFEAGTRSRYVATHDNGSTQWTLSDGIMIATAAVANARTALTLNSVYYKDVAVQTTSNWVAEGGLVLRYQDNANYYLVTFADGSSALNPGKVRLLKKVAGTYTLLAESTVLSMVRGVYHTFRFEAIGSALRALVDGSEVVSATDSSINNIGKIGLWANFDGTSGTNIFKTFGWTDLDKELTSSFIRFEGRDEDNIVLDDNGVAWDAGGGVAIDVDPIAASIYGKLAHWWPLDEASGNFKDVHGGQELRVGGSISRNQPPINPAGTASVSIPNHNGVLHTFGKPLWMQSSPHDITISHWYQANAVTAGDLRLLVMDSPLDDSSGGVNVIDSTRISTIGALGLGWEYGVGTDTGLYTDWTITTAASYLSATRLTAPKTCTFYINGTAPEGPEVFVENPTGGHSWDSYFTVGNVTDLTGAAGDRSMLGKMQDLTVFRTALTDEEQVWMYADGNGRSYWDLVIAATGQQRVEFTPARLSSKVTWIVADRSERQLSGSDVVTVENKAGFIKAFFNVPESPSGSSLAVYGAETLAGRSVLSGNGTQKMQGRLPNTKRAWKNVNGAMVAAVFKAGSQGSIFWQTNETSQAASLVRLNIAGSGNPNGGVSMGGRRISSNAFAEAVTSGDYRNQWTIAVGWMDHRTPMIGIRINGGTEDVRNMSPGWTAGLTANTTSRQKDAVIGQSMGTEQLNVWSMAELIVTETAPSMDDIYRIEGYLAWEWDLVHLLPVDHPYKTERPYLAMSTAI